MAKTTSKVPTRQTVADNRNSGFTLSGEAENRIAYVVLGLVLLLVALIRSKFLEIPFERDEGAYSYYGKLLLEGKTPYKDFYEQKFPGIFYFYAAIVGIFGDTVRGMHMGFMILNMLTITMLFFAAKKMFSPFAACLTAITYAIVSLTPQLSGFTVQSEHGVAFWSAMGLLLYVYSTATRKPWMYFLMGIAMGSAFMTKTTGMFIMLWGGFMVLVDYFFVYRNEFRLFIRNLLMYMAGATLVLGTLFLIMYIRGAFEEMVFWNYDIPKNYVSKVQLSEGVKYFGYTRDAVLGEHKIFWYHGLLAVIVCFLKNIPLRLKIFAVSMAGFSFMMIVPGYFFYGHYWIQLIPGLSILTALTFHALAGFISIRVRKAQLIRVLYVGAFTFAALMHLNKMKDYYFNPNYDRILRMVYGSNPFPETMEIARYINANAKPEDRAIFMGSEPQFYFYTKRNCPTRHAYFAVVVETMPQHKQWQREYAADIEKAKPRYFIFARHSISLLVQPNTDNFIFEWANKYINDNYRLTGVVDMPDGSLNSTYVWGQEALSYQPKGQNCIFVFERKS